MATAGDTSIGDRCNDWRIPVCTFGQQEDYIKSKIPCLIQEMQIPENVWIEHCKTVNVLLDKMYDKVKKNAEKKFEGLEIRGPLIKFGSSRDGLKVHDALEYDTVLLFDIKGMRIEPIQINGKPGFLKIKVPNGYNIIQMYPWILREQVIEEEQDSNYYLNTKNLQETIFKSAIDKTRADYNDQLKEMGSLNRINRTEKPPTFDINITLNKEDNITDLRDQIFQLQSEAVCQDIAYSSNMSKRSLNIDFVPALLVRHDNVPDPFCVGGSGYYIQSMRCPVYAVMKWAHRSHDSATELYSDHFWRECTSGYEKHILDVARRNDSQRYLMTACRLLKTYVINLPDYNQLKKVVASQYLKTICFYCIALLTVPSGQKRLQRFQEALGYFLNFLELCIEAKNLPHFFFGNPYLQLLFPDSPFVDRQQKKNLYSAISCDTFLQAEREFASMKAHLSGVYTEFQYLDQNVVGQFQDLLH